MSKGKVKFNNKAARRFNDIGKVDTMSQSEVFSILAEDLTTILGQVTAFREHRPGSPFPNYIGNAFANLSTALFFYRLVAKNGKIDDDIRVDVSEFGSDEAESLRMIIADAYNKSTANTYEKQVQEYADRNELLGKTFKLLYRRVYKLTKKLKLDKAQRRDLTLRIYGDPVFNMRHVHKAFNQSTVSDKKKLKLMRKMYGKKRFVAAVGAAMTVDSASSDCLAMLFEYMVKLKKKRRAPYIRAYADAYKRIKGKYFRMDSTFRDKNKPIIKELKRIDVGYKKAFKNMKALNGSKKNSDKKRREDGFGKPDRR